MIRTLRAALAVAPVLLAVMASGPSAAADYPDRDVVLTVGYAAGGVTDVSARILAKAMEKDLGRSLVIMNRAGAQATIGPAFLAKQAPDGYNVGVLTFAPLAIVPHMLPVSFKTDDFTYIGAFGRFQYGLAVRADSPYKTVADLVAAAKTGKSVFFSAPGAPNNIAFFELGRKTGAKFEQILYKSGQESVLAVLTGNCEAVIQSPSELVPHVKAGKLRLLASVSPSRWPDRPDLPTMAEAGFDVQIESWMGLGVPKGTPPAIVARLQQSMFTAMKDPEVLQTFQGMGIDPVSMTGPEYARKVTEGYVEMGKMMKDAGLLNKGS
jgi:tripartite-type tricarboxylate transporter receptor subunit TctC